MLAARRLPRLVLIVLLLAALLHSPGPAAAQEGSDDSPVGQIIPKPDSGEAPDEAGDRGGSLQVGLLGLIGVVIAGMTFHVVRQSRDARMARLERARRAAEDRQPTKASQASSPLRNPDR